ncbi:hypothetical protein V8C86DRAFT_1778904, partial [Haematococcus lacustris]
GWPRIIQPPKRKGGHVILDMCTAATVAGPRDACSSDGGPQIVRQTVSKARVLGRHAEPAYALAKSASWGDLWP